ncbi:MAG: diadenylate cyclase CdaA [Clostridium luticellarii]|uniref:Diadenylate cyclase n=1 Tax=Clostridium luticellarii TaxID=1691940 RepID=A0A2T0BSC1_9CLOT|nr:diadenylate cyclase CdaA [Clostridium luticellarii]MCI1944733.1 diadenylate cyclase CdaA [Clostridium luticellarii]MCI1968230.1 diadenylate cyclase CdaA [Clostridium luticellarii]MCI1995225.1 diadenylate cyclase CdaA [Clostridium luticellarii]MCI2039778.1 diadenylate cyclase CdaA [Clostridium luticellarii]PRR86759.1 DNA integrity scanning protein DisA [Clostridium luticellarii]
MELLQIIINSVKNISIWSIMDILVVSYILYKAYMLIKETRAEQLLKGIVLITVLIPISSFLHLVMLNWILTKTLTIGVLSFVIIFQPEIRRALEHLGTAFNDKHVLQDEEVMEKVVTEIVNCVDNLSKSKTGALIVIEQITGLGDIINTGTKIDAVVSSALLENIFVVNTPLHDGATIIRNDRIISAGCFLPLTNNNELNKKLGTRHRAAIGISENSDALIIVVSEETGTISFAANGKLIRNYSKDRLKKILISIMKKRFQKKSTLGEKVTEWKEKIKRAKF